MVHSRAILPWYSRIYLSLESPIKFSRLKFWYIEIHFELAGKILIIGKNSVFIWATSIKLLDYFSTSLELRNLNYFILTISLQIIIFNYCQAQFQSSPSPVQLELRLALSLIITTPTLTHPPRKVEMQLEIDNIYGQ